MVLQSPPESPVLRFQEASEYLGIGPTTLRKLIASGEVPTIRFGGRRAVRFLRASLDEDLRSAETTDSD